MLRFLFAKNGQRPVDFLERRFQIIVGDHAALGPGALGGTRVGVHSLEFRDLPFAGLVVTRHQFANGLLDVTHPDFSYSFGFHIVVKLREPLHQPLEGSVTEMLVVEGISGP
jgi:hypothetical protein